MESVLGKALPDMTLKITDGSEINLADLKGKRIVLYFYPQDMTSVCTEQACAFGDMYPRYQEIDCLVFGVSTDSVESHKEFTEKNSLPFPLISDTDNQLAKYFDLPPFSRATFVFNSEGEVDQEWEDVDITNHAYIVWSTVDFSVK